MKTKIATVILLCAVAAGSLCFAELSRDKEREIRKLLEATGMLKAVVEMKGRMIQQFRTAYPKVSKAFWDELAKEMDADELITLMMPIYDKHLSLEDIKAANTFYETPAGKRLSEKTSVMASEGSEVGRAWGAAKGRLVDQRLKEKGMEK